MMILSSFPTILCFLCCSKIGTSSFALASIDMLRDSSSSSHENIIWTAQGTTNDGPPNVIISHNIPSASSSCWLTAASALEFLLDDADGKSDDDDNNNMKYVGKTFGQMGVESCRRMESIHQKILALELAKCHLMDLGRPLFLEVNENNHERDHDHDHDHETKENEKKKDDIDNLNLSVGLCSSSDTYYHNRENLSTCLSKLTDMGVSTYTHFFSYINQICIRLMQEIVITQHYRTSMELATSSKLAERRLKDILREQQQVHELWSVREDQLSKLHVQLQDQIDSYGLHMSDLSIKLQNELQTNQENWLQEQTNRQQYHVEEMKRQQELLVQLQQQVQTTNRSMLPWSVWFDSLTSVASTSYFILQGLAFVLTYIVLVWIFTAVSKRLYRLRKYMIGLMFIDLMIEFMILTGRGMDAETVMSLPSEREKRCCEIRTMFVAVSCLFYILGLFMSCCCCQQEYKSNSSSSIYDNDGSLQQRRQDVIAFHRFGDIIQRLENCEKQALNMTTHYLDTYQSSQQERRANETNEYVATTQRVRITSPDDVNYHDGTSSTTSTVKEGTPSASQNMQQQLQPTSMVTRVSQPQLSPSQLCPGWNDSTTIMTNSWPPSQHSQQSNSTPNPSWLDHFHHQQQPSVSGDTGTSSSSSSSIRNTVKGTSTSQRQEESSSNCVSPEMDSSTIVTDREICPTTMEDEGYKYHQHHVEDNYEKERVNRKRNSESISDDNNLEDENNEKKKQRTE